MFLFLGDDIRKGMNILKASSTYVIGLRWTYIVFTLNLLTQLICVSGVNQMTSVRSLFLFVTLRPPKCTSSLKRVSSVTTNLVLTTRKAVSLCLSVWIFRGEWNLELVFGACLVFFGSFLYTASTARIGRQDYKKQ